MGKLWAWYPPIGVYIAVLALLGVLVPFFRDLSKIGKREKALWTAIMFLLVFLEIKSIYQDRNTHENEQQYAREEQLKEFQKIADGIDRTLTNSQQQFSATMGRIDTTLQTSERTLRNTRPSASLEFQKMLPYGPSLPIAPNHPLQFNIWFTDYGNDVARDSTIGAKFYARKPGDKQAEKEIDADFDRWWKASSFSIPESQQGLTIKPNYPTFTSITSDPFSETDVKGLLDHTLTLYVLIRVTWWDRTGHWVTDDCSWYQDPTHDFVVSLPCKYHNKHRYRLTPHQ